MGVGFVRQNPCAPFGFWCDKAKRARCVFSLSVHSAKVFQHLSMPVKYNVSVRKQAGKRGPAAMLHAERRGVPVDTTTIIIVVVCIVVIGAAMVMSYKR